MQKRLFNHLMKSRYQRRPNRLSDGFVILACEAVTYKYAAFLNHIIHPLNIRNKYYSPLPFIFGLPYLLRQDRIIDRTKKPIVHVQYVSETLNRLSSNISNYQHATQAIQKHQKKIFNISVATSKTIAKNLQQTGMHQLIPVIKNTLIRYNTRKSIQKVFRQAINTSTLITNPEKFQRSIQHHLRHSQQMVVPGTIKTRANFDHTDQLVHGNYHQTKHNISPVYVEKQNFNINSLHKNIINKIDYFRKFFFRNVQAHIFTETENLLQHDQWSLGIEFKPLMSRAIIKNEKENLRRPIANNVTMNVGKFRHDHRKPLNVIQRYSITPVVKSSRETPLVQNKLSRLIHQNQQAQKNLIQAARKQKPLQQPPELIHPQAAAVTANIRKVATETLSDSNQPPAFTLPRPAGIAEVSRLNDSTDLGVLTDKVMEQIEQRIRTEQERRGIFV